MRFGWVLPGATLLLTMAAEAAACGGGVVSSKTSVSEGVTSNTQRVFLSFHDSVTDVVVQLGVPGGAESYGALLPVSGEPVLDSESIPADELDALDRRTAPSIIREEVEGSSDSGGGGCGCFASGADAAGSDTKGGGTPNTVQVGAPVNIGPVSATVLRAEDEEALRGWLEGNEFALPDGSDDVLGSYIGADRYFVALRRSSDAPSAEPSSVGLHFTVPGDGRYFPMRFARLGSSGTQAFTLFIASSEAVGPMPGYVALTLDDLDWRDLWDTSYEESVARLVAKHGGEAFVLERTFRVNDTPLDGRLGGMTASRAVVTRMTSVVSGKPDEDVYFDALDLETVPSYRRLIRTVSEPVPAAASALSFLGLTCVRRRKRAA